MTVARKPGIDVWISLALLAATFALYSPVSRFDFIGYDDPDYVQKNLHLRDGISMRGIEWAFTSGEAANWFPLTRLSYLLEYRLFGLASGGYHLTNALLHALASVALFVFLLRATRQRWPSAFVAFLFALHPLHVESVAWVAERKDVLCALFWFLTLWAWVRYTERPAPRPWLLALLLFALGLMSKPMIVTLPFLLPLLDVWPLRRKFSRQLIAEKLPFFALSAALALITYLVQRHSGAVQELRRFPLGLRFQNALITWIVYIAKMFWPARLAVFYPYPKQVPLWQAAAAGLALACVSALVLRALQSRPYLAVGWFWYLGTLVPVIGLVQVGVQARADRYMYVPMVGLAIMLAWTAERATRQWPNARLWIALPAVAALAALLPVTWLQIRYWKNHETLFRHAIAVTDGNDEAYVLLGAALLPTPGRLPDAIALYEAGLRMNPREDRLQTNLGVGLLATGAPANMPIALAHLRTAVRLNPGSADNHVNLATGLVEAGRMAEAIDEAQAALRVNPDDAQAHYLLGFALSGMPGRADEAIAHFRAALKVKPDFIEAHVGLGLALTKAPGNTVEALLELEEALRIDPDYRPAHVTLAMFLAQIPGRLPEAIAHLGAALKIRPDAAMQKTLEEWEAR